MNNVIPKGYEPYGEYDPDDKIDAFLSVIGVYKRMCLDIIKVGIPTKILVVKKKRLKEKYHQKIKDTLKR